MRQALCCSRRRAARALLHMGRFVMRIRCGSYVRRKNSIAGVTTPETKAYFDPLWKLPHEVYAMFLYHYDIAEWDPRSFRIGEA
jgi:hypothetical protein